MAKNFVPSVKGERDVEKVIALSKFFAGGGGEIMVWKTGFNEPFLVVASDVGAWVSVTPNAGSISISVLKWRPFYETSVGKD